MSSLPKIALRDPANWLREISSACTDANLIDAAQSSVEELLPLIDQLESLSEEKGRISRQIGAAKKQGSDASSLIASMRETSDLSRATDVQIRGRLQEIAEMFSVKASPGADSTTVNGKSNDLPVESAGDRLPGYFSSSAYPGDCNAPATSSLSVSSEFSAQEYSDYVHAHPASTSYHELALRDLIPDTLGQQCHYLLARDENRTVRGVLPLVQLNTRLFGNYIVSMPWFNYGGPLSDDEPSATALMQSAVELARDAGCSHLEIRESRARPDWKVRTDKVSMVLSLPTDVATLEQSLGASLRAQSNKATRAGCTYKTGQQELLDDFYRVFSINMRDLGTPVQNRDFFKGLLELFASHAFIAIVYQNNKPVAAGFLLAHGNTLEIPWASSLRRANPLGVNMLLYRQTLAEAVSRGYQYFDFGRSTLGGPTWRFKKQWGAKPQQLYWHQWFADDTKSSGGLTPDNPKYRLAIATWQRHL